MEFIEISLLAPTESREALMSRMNEMGALGFEEREDRIIAYFEPSRSPEEICHELLGFKSVLSSSGLDPSFTCSFQVIPETDWNETWKKSFVPIDVGNSLTIVPSWLAAESSRMPVIIDPGMVFGTGHHETTRTCLILMERLTRYSAATKRFLDVGTGTGILAIGAARLGFGQIEAVDVDPLAVDAAVRNVAANGLSNIAVKQGTISATEGPFDVIAANLLSEILVDIAPEVTGRLHAGGTAILSGLLTGQEDDVLTAMSSAGLSFQEKIYDGKWVSLVFRK
ncbi:MAG TPA: 50S ribosomal protein L11 methyltransferase [Thermodesulfovibrionales bacterium]|nr:50S ribosomal protein L11 methyltransferase [Thermodesulfovibrionales bacterium]